MTERYGGALALMGGTPDQISQYGRFATDYTGCDERDSQ